MTETVCLFLDKAHRSDTHRRDVTHTHRHTHSHVTQAHPDAINVSRKGKSHRFSSHLFCKPCHHRWTHSSTPHPSFTRTCQPHSTSPQILQGSVLQLLYSTGRAQTLHIPFPNSLLHPLNSKQVMQSERGGVETDRVSCTGLHQTTRSGLQQPQAESNREPWCRGSASVMSHRELVAYG